jgi:hypothetical protein
MLAWWWVSGKLWPLVGYIPGIPSPYDGILFFGGIISLASALFALIVRNLAYVQAKADHIRLVTPFLALKISFRRIHSAHPVNFVQLFPPQEAKWHQRSSLTPFYGLTALVLELSGYPTSIGTLKLFLGRTMLLPKSIGFVLLVPDWMALSTEIESSLGAWRELQGRSRKPTSSSFDIMQSLRKK